MEEVFYSPIEIFNIFGITDGKDKINARAALNKFRKGTTYTYKSGDKRIKKAVAPKLVENEHYLSAPCPCCGHIDVKYTEKGLEKIKELWG